MPRVAQYQPNQVNTAIVRGPRAQGLPSAAFATGLEGLGDVAKDIADMGKRVATTEAEEALNAFERDKNNIFFNPENGYFNTQGRAAFDTADTTRKSLDDLARQYSEGLQSEQARQLFDRAAAAHITRSNTDIMRHASKGIQAWEVATIDANVENTLENASLYWNDPKRMKVQQTIGEQAILDSAQLQGLPPEATNERLQTYRSSFARGAVEAALVESSTQGQEVMDRYEKQLEGPDKIKLEKAIQTKQNLEKTQADAAQATLTAGVLIDKYDSLTEINNEVDKIDDPELRKKTQSEVTRQYNRQKTAEKEQQAEFYDQAIQMTNEGMSPIEIQTTNPAVWDGMTALQRNNIASGKHMVTDQILLSNLMSLPKAELADVVAVDYADRLKPADLQKLTNAVNSAKRGDSISRIKSLSSKAKSAATGVFGKEKGWYKGSGKMTEKGQRANEFLQTLQDAVEDAERLKGGDLTPSEEDQLISEFTREIAVERSLLGIDFLAPDIEIDLSNTPPEDLRLLNRVIDNTANIDVNDLVSAYQFMLDNDIQINSQNLRQVYQQGRQ